MRKRLTLLAAAVVVAAMWVAPSHAESDAPQLEMRDYEDYDVGEPERGASVGNAGEGTVLVTDEAAASGYQSLKFTDAAGLDFPWMPFVVYPLTQQDGSLKMTFDLRWDAGASMALEWRDAPEGYNIGPNLTTTPSGLLYANGKKLMKLPEGKWVHVEITCPLGPTANGKYDASATVPGSDPQVVKNISSSSKFKGVASVVFMSMAAKPTAFYIDNLSFVPKEN